jgi:hypothetical protein
MNIRTKRISNSKQRRDFGTIYSMRRTVGADCLGYDVAVTEQETEHRDHVAWKLKRARHELADAVKLAKSLARVRDAR